jgi:type IV secretory pathway TraG/TraD family ATPase VirD4
MVSAATVVLVVCARLLRTGAPETYKRGAIVRQVRGYNDGVGRPGKSREPPLLLAAVPIDFADETKHFKIIGTTGTGKSTAIHDLLSAALDRGDRAIFADPDGGYQSRFFKRYRGDVILNPFEPGSAAWNPFAEIREPFDIEQLASGLIPTSGDPTAGEWRGYARTFLCALLRKLRGRRQNSAELWRMISAADAEELRPLVAGTPAQPFLEAENARMFGSIRSVAVSALAAFEHVQAQRAVPFSIRSWVRRRSAAGALFFPYKAGQIAALKSLIAAWMRLAIFEAMSGQEGLDQRLWFVIDELDALGALEGLKDALARLRKFGGRCVLGFQSAAQVSSTYGPDAQTIVENCANTLILRCSASENGGTSQFASRLIGEREILRRQVSRGSDRSAALIRRGARRSKNTSEQHVIEAAVMPSQIEQLPDFCGYLKTASSREWRKVSFTHGRFHERRNR